MQFKRKIIPDNRPKFKDSVAFVIPGHCEYFKSNVKLINTTKNSMSDALLT